MKILITGGSGFIGSNLIKKLNAEGYTDIVVLDCLSKQIHGENPFLESELFLSIKDKVHFFHGDVTRKEDWEKVLDGVETIVHLAAETGTGQSMYEIVRYSDVNVNGTAILLEYLVNANHNVKKVVLSSTRALYGEGRYILPSTGEYVYPTYREITRLQRGEFDLYYNAEKLQLTSTDESSALNPLSIYGITKHTQEQMIMSVCATRNIAAVALRYQNVYGPGQSLKNPYTGILSIFSTLALTGKSINVFEDGMETRDFVYIDDVVNATYLAVTKDNANGEILNVGTGVPTNVMKVAEILVNAYQRGTNINISGMFRLGDIRHNYADITKAKKLLGFQPTVDFETGIRKFSDWVLTQPIQESKYDQSINEMKEKGLIK